MFEFILGPIRNFTQTEFYSSFLKNFFYFIILLSLCFFLIHRMYKDNRVYTIGGITRVMFLFLLYIIYCFVIDIIYPLEENTQKFSYYILFFILLTYFINYLIVYLFGEYNFYIKLCINISLSILFFLFTSIIIYFTFERNNSDKAKKLYENFLHSWNNNSSFFYVYIFFLFGYYYTFTYTKYKIKALDLTVSNILSAIVLLLFYIFIIYILRKLKIIKRTQVLSTVLVLLSVTMIIGYLYAYSLMSSITNICKKNIVENNEQGKDIISMLLFISIIILLLLQDTENWRQTGYFVFFIISIFIVLCLVYYSNKYPGIGMLSIWGMIEWILVLIYQNNASFNSVHYMLMKT